MSLFDQGEAFGHLLKNRRRPTEYDEILKVKEEIKKSIEIEENGRKSEIVNLKQGTRIFK